MDTTGMPFANECAAIARAATKDGHRVYNNTWEEANRQITELASKQGQELREACALLDNMTDMADAFALGCECDSEKHNADCLQPEIEARIGRARTFLKTHTPKDDQHGKG